MKKKQILSLVSVAVLSLFLTACGSAVAAGSWPGVTFDEPSGTVYVANNQFVHAVNVENGTERWQYPAEARGDFLTFAAPKLTTDAQLIVAAYDNKLYSLSPQNGSQIWAFAGASNRYIGAALPVGELIFAPNSDQKVYIVDGRGALVQTFGTQDPIWSEPASDGSVVYLTSMDHHLYALDAIRGDELWNADLGGTIVGAPVLGDGLIYVGTLDHSLVAVNADSGREVWRFTTTGWVWASPTLVEGQLFVGDLDGHFYALDAASGEKLWQVDTGGAITGSAAFFADSLYIGNGAGQLYSIGLDGRSRQLALPEAYEGPLYGSPIVAGDLLLIGLTGKESTLIALDVDGNVVWNFVP